MDVPSWHPANQDADLTRRLAMTSASVPRTEMKVMPGSSPDTSTEAGRQLMSELGGGGGGGGAPRGSEGRGFYDASDRLYLIEQKKIAEAQKNRRKAEEDAQLQSFRSTALKLQAAQKPALLAPEVVTATPKAAVTPVAAGEKQPALLASAVVTIKPKKRRTIETAPDASTKRAKAGKATAQPPKPKEEAAASDRASPTKPSVQSPAAAVAGASKPIASAQATGSLLLGYSSSSSDDDA